MAAAGKDLVPLVERGGGRLEHDQVFLLEAKSTQPRRWVEAAGSGPPLSDIFFLGSHDITRYFRF